VLSTDQVAYELGNLFDLVHGGSRDGAERLFDAALAHNPDHARALASRASLRAGRDDDEAVLMQLRSAIAMAPQDPRVHILYGRQLFRMYTEGAEAGQRLAPYEQRPLLADARKQLVRTIELDPLGAEAYYWLGLSYLFEGRDLRAAEQALERARELAPWSSEIALRLSETYLAQGKNRRARRMLKAVRRWAHHPQDAARAQALLEMAGKKRWGSAGPE
jgi:Tfp pilus assembly protein PilF